MNDEIKSDEVKVKNKKIKKAAKKDKTSRRGKLNFLDVVILACVLAVAALLFFVYSPFELLGVSSRDTNIIYTLRISGVSPSYAASISVGDVISDPDGYNLGVVASDVEVEPHSMYVYRENADGSGGIVQIKHPELIDLIITVTAEAEHGADGYTVDGKRIAVEAEYEIVLPKFESKGICISLSEESANDAGA